MAPRTPVGGEGWTGEPPVLRLRRAVRSLARQGSPPTVTKRRFTEKGASNECRRPLPNGADGGAGPLANGADGASAAECQPPLPNGGPRRRARQMSAGDR
jgi:hypothetical protein